MGRCTNLSKTIVILSGGRRAESKDPLTIAPGLKIRGFFDSVLRTPLRMTADFFDTLRGVADGRPLCCLFFLKNLLIQLSLLPAGAFAADRTGVTGPDALVGVAAV